MNPESLQHTDPGHALEQVRNQLTRLELLRGLEEHGGRRQDLVQQVTIRQQQAVLAREINNLHPADIAYVLENLPLPDRLSVWQLVRPESDGAVLLEVSDAVRDTLIRDMDRDEIVGAAGHLDSDELADLVPDLPSDVVAELLQSLGRQQREQVTTMLAFPEHSVGALMDFDYVAIRDDVSLDVVVRYLRARSNLPENLQELMVVSRDGQYRGSLNLRTVLLHPADTLVESVMNPSALYFHTSDDISDAVNAFERYGLLSTPVINNHGQLVGMLHVDSIVEHMRDARQSELLSQAGLRDEEDLFAPVWQSARNRGLWLALNLVTAFIASRVIGAFSGTIEQIVALAALMPIVAAVGGNTGNQTLALVIRSIALNQVDETNFRHLVAKEAAIGLISGTVWGAAMALVTYLIYGDAAISLVLLVSMMMTLSLAAVAGVLTPSALRRAGLDPAYGSSVILTGITDSLGFFLFLGLATLVLTF